MESPRDPFQVLSLAYDASLEDVRRAFRQLARKTHPDLGGSSDAFHEARAAFRVLYDDLEGERRRWGRAQRLASRYPAGLDPQVYPTCPVLVSHSPSGRLIISYEVEARPSRWKPVTEPPPSGTCVMRVAATGDAPAFGVWVVPLDAQRYRCVFGPYPDQKAT